MMEKAMNIRQTTKAADREHPACFDDPTFPYDLPSGLPADFSYPSDDISDEDVVCDCPACMQGSAANLCVGWALPAASERARELLGWHG